MQILESTLIKQANDHTCKQRQYPQQKYLQLSEYFLVLGSFI